MSTAAIETDKTGSDRFALVIATSEYDDTDLRKLVSPGHDAKALSSTLQNPNIGGFNLKVITNGTSSNICEEIEAFFSERKRDDVLLLYFSCHGFKDVDGRLYFASTNTRRKLLASTAVSANFVNEVMERSRSKRQVLVLDCCYSGAFAKGLRHKAGDKSIHTGERFEGKGRIVLTASDSMQYSFEEDIREGHDEHSVFTSALVNGLETGKADIDRNGRISYHELYDYAFEQVRKETPLQNPGIWVFGVEGDVVIANNPNKNLDPTILIQEAIESLRREFNEAVINYSEGAIEINPRVAEAYTIKGEAFLNLKRYHEALSCFEKALDANPNNVVAWNNKGMSLNSLGKYEEALGCFNTALSLKDDYDQALHNRDSVRVILAGKQSGLKYSFVTKWGSSGNDHGQFYGPQGITVDPSGNICVTEYFGYRIQKFDNNGKFITKWGSEGTGDGQFCNPYGIAVDPSGNVYVADVSEARIQKFDSNGKFITKWGSEGTGGGQFRDPYGIAVDPSGNVYVADVSEARIQKFDSNGKFITKWGSEGTGDGQFRDPYGIAVDPSGNVYISDIANNEIQKFDNNGKFITKWGSEGTGDGQFNAPNGVAVDSFGNVYVSDITNNEIQKFDSNGKFITKWGSEGTGDGQFNAPNGVAVDSFGNVYVSDTGNDRIQMFSCVL